MKNSLIKSNPQLQKSNNPNITVYDSNGNEIRPKNDKKTNSKAILIPIIIGSFLGLFGYGVYRSWANQQTYEYNQILIEKILTEDNTENTSKEFVQTPIENESSSATPITKDKCGVIVDKGFNEINGKKVYWFEVKEEGSVDTYIMSGVHEIVWKYSEVGKSTACK